jgi:putative hydrolase of the HAD superfamily
MSDASTRPVEAVIFDYGGVISMPFFDNLAAFEDEMGYPRGSISRLMFGDAHDHLSSTTGDPVDGAYDEGPVHDFHLLEMGGLSLDDYLQGLMRRAPDVVGQAVDFDAYTRFAASMPVLVQWPMVQRIRSLSTTGVRLALLTNNVKEFGDSWRSTFPVDELFRVVVDSSEVGMRKPDPRIYELTCELVGVEPAAAVFLDDNLDNVGAARALGIESVLVGPSSLDSIAELDAILERRGVRT